MQVSDEIPGGEIPNYENVTAACKPDRDFGDSYGSASGWGRLEDGKIPKNSTWHYFKLRIDEISKDSSGNVADHSGGSSIFLRLGANSQVGVILQFFLPKTAW